MTNQQFKCSLRKTPFKHKDFYHPGMSLVTLSQQEEFKHLRNKGVPVIKANKGKFKYVNSATNATHCQTHCPKHNANSAKKRKGYVTLKLGAVSKESNSSSLSLLNALNLTMAQLLLQHNNFCNDNFCAPFGAKAEGRFCNDKSKVSKVSKLPIETLVPQQQYKRHNARFANHLVQRFVPKHNQHRISSCKRFTVIRSPFVFKKSREQFVLTRNSCFVKLAMTKPQQHAYAQHLTATKLPSELQLTFVN